MAATGDVVGSAVRILMADADAPAPMRTGYQPGRAEEQLVLHRHGGLRRCGARAAIIARWHVMEPYVAARQRLLR
jgi:hypothetical protein